MKWFLLFLAFLLINTQNSKTIALNLKPMNNITLKKPHFCDWLLLVGCSLDHCCNSCCCFYYSPHQQPMTSAPSLASAYYLLVFDCFMQIQLVLNSIAITITLRFVCTCNAAVDSQCTPPPHHQISRPLVLPWILV